MQLLKQLYNNVLFNSIHIFYYIVDVVFFNVVYSLKKIMRGFYFQNFLFIFLKFILFLFFFEIFLFQKYF